MQPEMLKLIHRSHQGIAKSLSQVRDVLYWPGMLSQIQDVISSCLQYVSKKKNQKEPLIPHSVPDRPWLVDIFKLMESNTS